MILLEVMDTFVRPPKRLGGKIFTTFLRESAHCISMRCPTEVGPPIQDEYRSVLIIKWSQFCYLACTVREGQIKSWGRERPRSGKLRWLNPGW